jgi:DNA replication and repair protein RecF
MRFETLRVQALRCLTDVALPLVPGLNVFIGPNGAGKTSVLEAAFLLSHGRSFRAGAKDALLQRGASRLSVFAELRHARGTTRVGIGKEGARWEARMDGASVTLGQLVRACAVVCFEPGSHALIAGGAEERRRFLDWGVFHVEHGFQSAWQRYQRALKQRNSLLRSIHTIDTELYAPWEQELEQSAALIHAARQTYLDRLHPYLMAELASTVPELGPADLRYRRGWADDASLLDQLANQRERDRARGHTTLGSHRADWSLVMEHAPLREHLSRGQEKLVALSCLLAQATVYAEQHAGEWPIVCLDDLASELDEAHQAAIVGRLTGAGAQVLITGTERPAALDGAPHQLFHVEQGQVSRLL